MGTSPQDLDRLLANLRGGGGKDGNRKVAGQKGRRRQEESFMQSACVKWLRESYPHFALLLIAIPNARTGSGGADESAQAKEQRIRKELLRWKAEGGVAGAADLFLAVPCMTPTNRACGLWLEAKTDTGTQRHTQSDFEAAVVGQQYAYQVFRSLDQFKSIVGSYLAAAGYLPITDEEIWRRRQRHADDTTPLVTQLKKNG
jgi:hypothetical protein